MSESKTNAEIRAQQLEHLKRQAPTDGVKAAMALVYVTELGIIGIAWPASGLERAALREAMRVSLLQHEATMEQAAKATFHEQLRAIEQRRGPNDMPQTIVQGNS